MCMVCSTCKESSSFLNGKRDEDFKHQLHLAGKNHVFSLTLCFVHSRDLFLMGERRFLDHYKDFAVLMNESKLKDDSGSIF
jgi:hypothetical protein